MVTTPSLRGDEEQGVTFVELFFDLVFVFAVTQVTSVLAHDLTGGGVVRATIVFWLVWWAWTQYTWSLNEADTEHVAVRLLTLGATAVAFLMALTVPEITNDAGRVFCVAYLMLRIAGIWLQWRLAEGDATWTGAVKRWTALSSLGLVAVAVAAVLGPDKRFAALGVAAILDVVAAWQAGSAGEWRLFAGHFTERHGLFVIVALGESLIAAGVAASGQELGAELLVMASTAVVATCALWWTYFGWGKDAMEASFARSPADRVGRFARDVYSFGHFPIIAGVIGFAVAIEESVAHPNDPLESVGVAALVLGTVMFVGGGGIALFLSGNGFPLPRAVAVVLIGLAGVLFLETAAWVSMTVVAALVTGLAVIERPSNPADVTPSAPA